MARVPTQKEIAAFLIGHGIVDFVSGGRLTKIERNAIWKAIKRLGPPAARTTGRGLVGAGKALARRSPTVGMALTGYEAYERGRHDAEMGLPYTLQHLPAYPLMSPALGDYIGEQTGREGVGTLDVVTPALRVRKKVSTYARNVGRAMKAVKASVKGGKRGKLSNPKRTFSTVSKTVSKIMKGGTRPRTGIGSVISKAVKGTFKKRKEKRKKRQAMNGTYRIR